MDQLFTHQTLFDYHQIWEKMKLGETLTDDAALIADAMKEHPEFDPIWPEGEMALHPQEVGNTIVNPLIHTGLHVIVQKQLQNQSPEEVSIAFNTLLENGVSEHEAKHQLGGLWGNLYFQSIRQGAPLDDWTYIQSLRGIIGK
ncbi:MAG: DUF1841 family protein [Nitrospiria bacterium]